MQRISVLFFISSEFVYTGLVKRYGLLYDENNIVCKGESNMFYEKRRHGALAADKSQTCLFTAFTGAQCRKKLAGAVAALLLFLCCAGCGVRPPETRMQALSGDAGSFDDSNGVSVHDPSLFRAQDGTYYVTGSHIASAKSTDLVHWNTVQSGVFDSNRTLVGANATLREALKKPLEWCDGAQTLWERSEDAWETNVWASDILYNTAMEKYCYYACSSVWGSTASVIWFATSDSPEGPFTYSDVLVYSGFNRRTRLGKPRNEMHYSYTNLGTLIEEGLFSKEEVENAPWFDGEGNYDCSFGKYPNAIDPAPFYDKDGNLWLAYGSFSGGIYVMPLVEETGMPDYAAMRGQAAYDPYFGRQISCTNAETEGTGEGPFIVYDAQSGYYYLFLTYGALGALDGYSLREYRSENPDGPYLDAAGRDARSAENTGTPILGNYQFTADKTAYLSGGHSSCLIDRDGRVYQAYHQRYNDGEGAFHNLQIHEMLHTDNGWLAMLPLAYQGETPAAVNAAQLTGAYEFVCFTEKLQKAESFAQVQDILSPTLKMTVRADGSVTADGQTGSWSFTGENTFVLTLGDETYHGVCSFGTQNGAKKLTLSALSDKNHTLWAVAE